MRISDARLTEMLGESGARAYLGGEERMLAADLRDARAGNGRLQAACRSALSTIERLETAFPSGLPVDTEGALELLRTALEEHTP